MIDHLGVKSTRYEEAKAFYVTALEPLGYGIVLDFPGMACGFGPLPAKPKGQEHACLAPFWLSPVPEGGTVGPAHFAFKAASRKQVDEFYASALQAGAKDNGPPGLRTLYHANYYGAFVIDLDGNNIEAVCHQPE